jgi:hypothetical protein
MVYTGQFRALYVCTYTHVCMCVCMYVCMHAYMQEGSRVSSGSIVSDYGLDDRAIGVRSPAGAEYFSSNLCVQTGSGAPPSLLYNGYRGYFPRG